MGEWPSRAVTEFRGRAPPEPAGYAALIAHYGLSLPLPVATAAIAAQIERRQVGLPWPSRS